ncbi:MAG: hypothetical protein IIC96_17720, partial [Chloroflexi bacterium]|nr:hypothetical protein [Chloroflexota bacterium]
WFEVRVSLTGMDPDDGLSVVLPAKLADTTVSQLLDYTFPPGEEDRRAVASMFDLRANPDLPEIYAVFLDAFDEWRKGRCTLVFTGGDGQDLDLAGLVSRQLEFSSAEAEAPANGNPPNPPLSALPQKRPQRVTLSLPKGLPQVSHASKILRCAQDDSFGASSSLPKGCEGGIPRAGVESISKGDRQSPYPRLAIHIERQYRAMEYATQMGFWGSSEELLEWLRSLTILYFMDKHEAEIEVSPPSDIGPGLMAAAALHAKDLISCSQDTKTFGITEEGRGFLSRLLTETESYIDLYDHFKDTSFDLNGDAFEFDTINFDTGRGVDLRVQVFLAEGLDPIRTVFLLRLYDGTLDDSVSNWKSLIDDESFFDRILEPVVNRYEVDGTVIGQIVESGYDFLEERETRARELESQREIIGRVWA